MATIWDESGGYRDDADKQALAGLLGSDTSPMSKMMSNPLLYLGLGLLGTARTKAPMSGALLGLNAYNDAIKSRLVSQPKLYGTVIWGKDRDGNYKPYQMSDVGGAYELGSGRPASPDLEWQRSPYEWLNMGGSMLPVLPGTGEAGAPLPKTLPPEQEPAVKGEQARQTSIGTEEGKRQYAAIADFPKLQEDANYTIDLLDKMVTHGGLEYAVGKSSLLPIIPGTEAADFMALYNQIQGQKFMRAYETLKGGGQITEVEGVKAEAALSRMERSQTEKEFISAAKEFSSILQKGIDRASKARAPKDYGQYDVPISQPQYEYTDEEIEAEKRRRGLIK